MTLTKDQVFALDFSHMPPAAKKASDYATSTTHDARTTRDTIFGLDWSGGARAVATDRAAREYTQLNRLSMAFTSLSTAINRGHASMSDLAGDLKQTASAYEADSYRIANDWSVQDTYNYTTAEQVAGGDRNALDALRKLKAARAQIAANGQRTLQKWASDLGVVDLGTAAAIRAALARLGEMAPPAAGLSAGLAREIVDTLLRGGALTPEQLVALNAACSLTPEQLRAQRLGRPVDIPQGQYDFLRALAAGLNGKSIAEITNLGSGDQKREIQRFLANGMQMVSTPQLTTRGGDRGGMRVVPASIRSLLTDNLIGDRFHVPARAPRGNPAFVEIPRIEDYQALVRFLAAGDPQLRVGTDLDRGVLKQAAQIADAVRGTDGAASKVGDPHAYSFGKPQVTEILNEALALTGHDTTAAHDFITGKNMDVTVPDGAHYDADHHLDALFQYQWGAKPGGIDSVFGWIGEHAGSPSNPFLAREAAESATALGHYFGDETNVSIGRDVGVGSPHLTQTLAVTLSPYLGDFAGSFGGETAVPKYGAQELSHGELTRMFSALDSDPKAAALINHAGTQWQHFLAYQAGAHDAPQLAKATGFLASAMKAGYTAEFDYLANSSYEGKMQDYQNKANEASFVRNLVAALPHPAIPIVNALLPPDLEQKLFGAPPDLTTMTDERRKLYDAMPTFNDPNAFQFAYFAGAMSTDPDLRREFASCLDEHGNPDWHKVKLLDGGYYGSGTWTKRMGELMVIWQSIYPNGVNAPEDPSQPMPGTIPAHPPFNRNPGPGG